MVIYNHGTRNPRKKERCNASFNRVPESLTALSGERFIIYYLCSDATEGTARSQAGNQVYARMDEIEQAMDGIIEQGILPEHLFLAGHSKGAWVILMLMNQVNRKFNAAIYLRLRWQIVKALEITRGGETGSGLNKSGRCCVRPVSKH